MGKKSRQITEFPQAFHEATPYGLNEFTPSARTLSDLNNDFCGEDDPSSSGSRVAVRMGKAVFVGKFLRVF